jgi:hypothetical protein
MTYVVGFKQPGINAIISDVRVSWQGTEGWQGENTALKTGVLFPGCIFGRVGSAYHSRKFITRFKESIKRREICPLDLWHKFQQFVESYQFPKGNNDKFQLLLSTRSSGEPRFHLLDSLAGISGIDTNSEYHFISFGSGKKVLESFERKQFVPRLKALQNYLISNRDWPPPVIHMISPYCLCLWLSELSLTFESGLLKQHFVGGVFHFICQTNGVEAPQKPTIYIFSARIPDSRTIYSWIYRVAYVQKGLWVEAHMPPNQNARAPNGQSEKMILFDEASRDDIRNVDRGTLDKEIKDELNSLPFYFFCGFGFANPSDRNLYSFIASTSGRREDIFDKAGDLMPGPRGFITSNYDNRECSSGPKGALFIKKPFPH